MPNPIVSKLSKALIALADKGENVPINRVEKRLETAGVRQDELEAAGIPSLLGESPTVTTRSGNEAVTPQSILDLDANRLDAPAITNDGLIAEETALFKEQNKEVLTGSDLQAQVNRESPEWHEQRIARLQLEIDNNNEYLRELELEPDSQFEMEDVALQNAEFEDDIEIYEEQLFELTERLANPVPDTTPAIREQTRDVPEGVSGIRGEIFQTIAPKDVNLDTYGVSIFTDARTKRNSAGVEGDRELESAHFPTFDDYSYHMRWDIEEDGNTLRIFEMQNDLSPTGEGPLINNFFGTDGNLSKLPDALLPQAEKNNLEKIFNETVKTKQKLTETILDPILKAHDFEIKLTADDLVDENAARPLDGTERWEMSTYNEFSDTYDVREITSPPGMGREIHILEKGEDFDFIGEDITNDVLSQVKTAHEEFTSSLVKLFEESESITTKAQETINFNFNKQFDQTYDPYQNLINRAIVKADAENLDRVKFLIGNNSSTSTEYMGISDYYSENKRGLLVRSLSIQKHYESVIAGQIKRTAEKIGARAILDSKGYLILTLPVAGFSLPLYADEEDKESSFIATATVRGNDPEEAREYLNNRQPQSPPPLPEGRSVRGDFNTGGKVLGSLQRTRKAEGGIFGLLEKGIKKGAAYLGFDDDRQLQISADATDLTKQIAPDKEVTWVHQGSPITTEQLRNLKTNRDQISLSGDEETFDAVNHALFGYESGAGPMTAFAGQAKEVYQGAKQAMRGKEWRTELKDMWNNSWGIDQRKQNLSRPEFDMNLAQAIMDTKGRMERGEALQMGRDIIINPRDLAQ
tara:strand:- start:1958 stop:4387 length:2430 start_codon:yes stop_codon:yes gene_type:complete